MKIAIAELKRMLPVGQEYMAEFIGVNRIHCKPGIQLTKRIVVKSNSELISKFLDGPRINELIYLGSWVGITADKREDGIYLSSSEIGEFLKISL